MTYAVTDSGQEFIVYHSEFRSKIEPLLEGRVGLDVAHISKDEKPNKVIRTTLHASKFGLTGRSQNIDFATIEWPADAPSTIIYTSGTTGPPKVSLEEATL